jgi:hypothetical protein
MAILLGSSARMRSKPLMVVAALLELRAAVVFLYVACRIAFRYDAMVGVRTVG